MAIDILLKLDNIPGEASGPGPHKGEIEVMAWGWGVTHSASAQSGTTRPKTPFGTISELSLTKWVDKASVPLFMAMASGNHIPSAKLTFIKASTRGSFTDFLTISMKDILITSLSDGGSSSSGDSRLTESVTLNFNEIDIKYLMQNPDGTYSSPYEASWDLAKGKPG